jgi:hypothetical protein
MNNKQSAGKRFLLHYMLVSRYTEVTSEEYCGFAENFFDTDKRDTYWTGRCEGYKYSVEIVT